VTEELLPSVAVKRCAASVSPRCVALTKDCNARTLPTIGAPTAFET